MKIRIKMQQLSFPLISFKIIGIIYIFLNRAALVVIVILSLIQIQIIYK